MLLLLCLQKQGVACFMYSMCVIMYLLFMCSNFLIKKKERIESQIVRSLILQMSHLTSWDFIRMWHHSNFTVHHKSNLAAVCETLRVHC